jgi:hypothetical protein
VELTVPLNNAVETVGFLETWAYFSVSITKNAIMDTANNC